MSGEAEESLLNLQLPPFLLYTRWIVCNSIDKLHQPNRMQNFAHWPSLRRAAFRLLPALLLSLPGSMLGAVADSGVALIRSRAGQADAQATPQPFEKAEVFAIVTHVYNAAGTRTIVENNRVAAIVRWGDVFERPLVDAADRAAIVAKQAELTTLSQKYPQVGAHLQKPLAGLQAALTQMDAGQIRLRGEWMARANYEEMVRSENAALAGEKRARGMNTAEETSKENQEAAKNEAMAEEDAAQRAANLNLRTSNPAGMFLLYMFSSLDKSLTQREGQWSFLPDSKKLMADLSQIYSLPLVGGYHAEYSSGSSAWDVAVMRVGDQEASAAVMVGVALRFDGKTLLNPKALESMRARLETQCPGTAEWLPLALVSARSKWQLQPKTANYVRRMAVLRQINGIWCEAFLGPQELDDDGHEYRVFAVALY